VLYGSTGAFTRESSSGGTRAGGRSASWWFIQVIWVKTALNALHTAGTGEGFREWHVWVNIVLIVSGCMLTIFLPYADPADMRLELSSLLALGGAVQLASRFEAEELAGHAPLSVPTAVFLLLIPLGIYIFDTVQGQCIVTVEDDPDPPPPLDGAGKEAPGESAGPQVRSVASSGRPSLRACRRLQTCGSPCFARDFAGRRRGRGAAPGRVGRGDGHRARRGQGRRPRQPRPRQAHAAAPALPRRQHPGVSRAHPCLELTMGKPSRRISLHDATDQVVHDT
jgi:hypothetical protein